MLNQIDEISVDSTMDMTDTDSTETFVNDYTAPRADKSEEFIGELSSFLESDKIPDAIAHLL